MIYTADGLFEIPETYIALDLHNGANPSHLSENDRLVFSGFGGFADRRLCHGAFRGDDLLRFLSKRGALATEHQMAARVFSGGVVVLKNDVALQDSDFDTERMCQWREFPRDMPEQSEVLWCVRMWVDPCHRGFDDHFGKGFLFPVARTHSLDAALACFEQDSLDLVTEDPYPAHRQLLQGPLKQTTSTFDPVLWPLNMAVDKLNYTEAVFAMSLRPAPCMSDVVLPSKSPKQPRVFVEFEGGGRLIDRPFSTVASLDSDLDCFARPLKFQGSRRRLPLIPDDVLERVFSMATTRALAGNTLYDWEMYRSLRRVSKELCQSVDKASGTIIHILRNGIVPMTPSGRHIKWERVRSVRETALNANLHPIEVIKNGSCLDHLTISRIRSGHSTW